MYPSSKEAKNTTRMTMEGTSFYLSCTMAELARKKDNREPPVLKDEELPFLSAIVKKRIEAMKLPISFSPEALIALNALCDRPGSAVLFLIDCLNEYKDQEVGMSELAELYPWGFYKEDVMIEIIDNFMKPRKHPWSEIY